MYSIKLSQLVTKTSKTAPSNETSRNAQLLIQAGFVHKAMAGVYAYTPLGLQVLENIKTIVREEMNAIEGQELIMTSLQPRELWETTSRWNDDVVDVWFKSQLKDGTDVGFAWSHEEAIIDMMKQHISSYKDLPANVYQFQTKLRNELRAKSGIMRGREFVMKDMYSMSRNAKQHDAYYEQVTQAYIRIFERLGLGDDTFVTYASGGAFTQFSHEFQTICDAGEDLIYVHREKNIAINEEVLETVNYEELGIKREDLEAVKSAEVGNIFNFGTQKSQEMDFGFTDENGERQFIHLGSYGIGITRLMGVIAEKFADDRGLVWSDAVAPARVQLIVLGDDPEVTAAADTLYNALKTAAISVIYDDRDVRAGEKFADADLFGIPHRVVVSKKTLAQQSIEYKKRTESQSELIETNSIIETLMVS